MASNAKCILFLFLALCFSFQIHARDSKFFSKVSKNTKENHESISVSPTQAPALSPSPSPEPEVIEHGYGLYGQDSYQNYEYPPTTKNPTKVSGEEKFVSGEELSRNNLNEFGNNEKQGMSDTRFLENGKYYYDPNQDVKDESSYFQKKGNGNGNGYERKRERQGMSDTRFLENGKYYHDINEEEKNNGHFNSNNYENENFEEDEEENNAHFNTNNFENENEFENENFEDEKDGKYYHGHNNARMAIKEGKNGRFEIENNGNGNGNENFEAEKHGMSDTRFMENGKYYYDVENDKYSNNHMYNNFNNNNNNKFGVEDVGFHSNNNVEYAKSYKGNGNENNGYETEGRGGYNYNRNEYGYNGVKPKKFANVYDSMEEYDREQGYIDGQDKYVP